MKIGILTFHRGTNYGGFLQCFALYRFLKGEGHDVSVIDYSVAQRRSFLRQNIDRLLSISSFSDISDIIHGIFRKRVQNELTMTLEEMKKADSLFARARQKYLTMTESVTEKTIGPIANQFDVIVIGSDQVWADIHEKQPVFLGDWQPVFPGKLIAYAACSPLKKIQRPYIKRNTTLLSRFDGISVRDHHTAEIFEKAHKVQYPIAADPTLIFQRWKDFEETIETPEKYILFYIIRQEITGSLRDATARLKSLYPGRKVLAILTTETKVNRNTEGIDEFVIPTPFQWVYLIRHAECVLTDSFHCALFSIQFSVPFFAYYQESDIKKYRFMELRDLFGIPDNFITASKEIIRPLSTKHNMTCTKDFITKSSSFLSQNIATI